MRTTTGFLCLLLTAVTAGTALAATGDTIEEGFGTITIAQEGATKDVLGSWTLLRPDSSQVTLNKKELYESGSTPSGNYTLLIEKAQGTSVTVTFKKNGAIVSQNSTPKVSFALSNGDQVLIQASYTYTRTGIVSVTSDPLGVDFTLVGPNGITLEGVTPESLESVPEGLYSVTYYPPSSCTQPKSKSDQLVKDSRISFHIAFSCPALFNQEEYEKQLTNVTITDGNRTVILTDVPIGSWFATYVHTVAKTGIMSGYKDENGNLTGEFGPSDSVSLAQLAKVAHEVAGIDEQEMGGEASNTRARGTWFETYYNSAEQRSWQAYRNEHEDPARPATRSEVIATILQALDAPRLWPKGQIFTDIQPDTPYAACIETAAADGIISSDEASFRPDAPVNRAELAKMIALAIGQYIEDSPEFTGESY